VFLHTCSPMFDHYQACNTSAKGGWLEQAWWNLQLDVLHFSRLLRNASSQQQVVVMQLCSNDIKLNSLLIASMQKHYSAQQTDLHSWRYKILHAGSHIS
jgi:hypothetical protein